VTTSSLLDLEIRGVSVTTDGPAIEAIAHALRTEPRYFGPSSAPKMRAAEVARLARLAGPAAAGAYSGRELVGLAGLCPRPSGPGDADLYLAVLQPWRRAGIGRRLAATLVESAAGHGYTAVFIHTDCSNRAALALGLALGMDRTDLGRGRVELRYCAC
jgi:GNAT superfamily N-acetyltransferase